MEVCDRVEPGTVTGTASASGDGQGFWSGATRLALGRHALSLAARALRERGVHQVAVPDYHCLTMVSPFQLEGMHVAHVPVGHDLLADAAALRELVGPDPGAWAVLHCETFAAGASSELAGTLGDLVERGCALVVDATHTWPLPPRTVGLLPAGTPAIHLASVRKFAHLPDGALLTSSPGTTWPDAGRGPGDEAVTRAVLGGDEERAEDLMDAQLSPAAMSPQAARLLEDLDLDSLLTAHRGGARVLEEGLRDLGLDVLTADGTHFCTAFTHPRGPALVEALARAGVDGPVWWPRPRGWSRPWPDDVVTLPTDSATRAAEVVGVLSRILRSLP